MSSSSNGAAAASSILYAFVGKGRSVWADFQPKGANGFVALANPQKTATQMLGKLTESGKYNFQLNETRIAYALVDEGIVYGSICSTAISSSAAMVFLADVKDQFCSQFSQVDRTTAPENTTQFRRFSLALKKCTEIAYSGGQEKLTAVKQQIEDTRQIMSQNIDKVLERGEKLEDVMDKSEQMRDTADAFRKKGRELRRKMWYQNLKFKLIIAAVVAVIVLILFFSICNGIACVT